jgi:cysteine-rich repeat protein
MLGCLNDCTFDTSNCSTCGDGQIQGSEECDDNNTGAGDGCSDGCTVEPGYVCQGEPSQCTVLCTDDSQCPYICDEPTGLCVDEADILFVDCNAACPGTGTVADPYCSLAGAVAAAADGQFILVRPGVCTGALNINTVGVNIVGEAGAALQTGSCPAVTINGVTASIEGLTIRGQSGNNGGGVQVENGADATLSSNTIGPGDCTGIHCADSTCTVQGNLVVENLPGGVRQENSDFVMVNNIIVKNGNGGSTWGGVRISGPGTKVFVNNTVADNLVDTGEGYQGGVRCFDPTDLINCIIWQNDDNEVSSQCNVSFSDISQSGFAGTNGNINQNPLFVDPAADNYHISAPGSPCQDSGHPAGVPPAPAVDFDGQSRPLGFGVDMGADEAG